MKPKDNALEISNPRLLSAVYYSLLAIIVTIMLDVLIFALGMEKLLPIYKAIFLAVTVAALSAALFGKRIIQSPTPYHMRVFLWGFFMVILALPIYDLGLVYFIQEYHPAKFAHATGYVLLQLYLFVLIYSFIIVGLWLAILSGFAAIYLRGHVVSYILQATYQRPKRLHEVTIDSRKKNPHADNKKSN